MFKLTLMKLRLWADRALWTIGYRRGFINPWHLRVAMITINPSRMDGLKVFARGRNLLVNPDSAPEAPSAS